MPFLLSVCLLAFSAIPHVFAPPTGSDWLDLILQQDPNLPSGSESQSHPPINLYIVGPAPDPNNAKLRGRTHFLNDQAHARYSDAITSSYVQAFGDLEARLFIYDASETFEVKVWSPTLHAALEHVNDKCKQGDISVLMLTTPLHIIAQDKEEINNAVDDLIDKKGVYVLVGPVHHKFQEVVIRIGPIDETTKILMGNAREVDLGIPTPSRGMAILEAGAAIAKIVLKSYEEKQALPHPAQIKDLITGKSIENLIPGSKPYPQEKDRKRKPASGRASVATGHQEKGHYSPAGLHVGPIVSPLAVQGVWDTAHPTRDAPNSQYGEPGVGHYTSSAQHAQGQWRY